MLKKPQKSKNPQINLTYLENESCHIRQCDLYGHGVQDVGFVVLTKQVPLIYCVRKYSTYVLAESKRAHSPLGI